MQAYHVVSGPSRHPLCCQSMPQPAGIDPDLRKACAPAAPADWCGKREPGPIPVPHHQEEQLGHSHPPLTAGQHCHLPSPVRWRVRALLSRGDGRCIPVFHPGAQQRHVGPYRAPCVSWSWWCTCICFGWRIDSLRSINIWAIFGSRIRCLRGRTAKLLSRYLTWTYRRCRHIYSDALVIKICRYPI